MAEPFLGEVKLFAGTFAPVGWAMCDGQLMSIAQNSALFALLGTTYGGDGIQTFALPDFRGRLPVNQGQGLGLSTYVLGEVTGTQNVTVLQSQMAVHNHAVNGNSGAATQASPAGNVWAAPQDAGGGGFGYLNGAPNAPMSGAAIGITGGSQPVPIVQPILCLTFIIALNGVFPSRN